MECAGELTDHAAVAVGDFVYIIGGADVNGNVTNQVLKYDPVLHTFTNMSSMPQPRYRFGATLLDSESELPTTFATIYALLVQQPTLAGD